MFKVGLCFGVVGHYWYKFLDWKFVGHTGVALGKKLLSEVVAGPLFGLGMFLGVGYAEGKERRQSIIDFLGNVENLIIVSMDCKATESSLVLFSPGRYFLLHPLSIL